MTIADTVDLVSVEQINYYAWDRSSKACKQAARGHGLAHPKRDRRARDYIAQLFGDSDEENGPTAQPAVHRRDTQKKSKLASPPPPPAPLPPSSSPHHSSGI
jgi:hypothetical protein